jgi:transcriptional regulator with XRE-family HTH domain
MPGKKADTVDSQVGANIRLHRLRCGLTQQALGHVLGVSYQQVQKYEKGRDRIAARHLFVISRALRVPIDELFS